MKVKSLLLLASLFLSLAADAEGGSTAGDGGHGVTCTAENGNVTVELLDLYEARRLWKFTPSLRADDVNEPYYLDIAVLEAESRLKETVSPTPEILNSFDYAYFLIAKMKPDQHTGKPDTTFDSGTIQVSIPKNCRLTQIARREAFEGGKFRIEYDPKAFLAMSPVDREAMILHETFHAYFGSRGNTLAVRQFVGYLTAPREFRLRNAKAFLTLLQTKQPIDPKLFQ